MALTKQDLSAIDQIVVKRIKPLESDIKTVKQDISLLKSDVKIIKSDLKTTINFFDKENLALKKRVAKTEVKLGIPAPEF